MPHSFEAPLIFALGHIVAVPPSSVSLNGLHPHHSIRHSSPSLLSSVPNDCYPFISVLERAKDWLPQDCRSRSLKGCVTLKIKTHHVEREQKLAIPIEHARLKDLVGAYFTEAKWYDEGYVPSMDEHMAIALLSCGYQSVSTMSLIGMGELATKEAFDWVSSYPLIVHASSVVCRLMDDMAGHKHEQERGHLASSIECYMKQYGATEEEAIVEFQKRVTNAWKDMNSECLHPTPVPMPLLQLPLNLARIIYVLYNGGDNYTHSGTKLKGFVALVLVDSVPT